MFLDAAVVIIAVFLLMLSAGCIIAAVNETIPGLLVPGVFILTFTLLLLHFLCVNNVISICPASYATGCSK